ncbi:MAG: tetratricopeptide repeat protein [Elusimicrobiota bacterium]|nr:tetratricopeptide repeat protein [Elusimicrobiota bacterium]
MNKFLVFAFLNVTLFLGYAIGENTKNHYSSNIKSTAYLNSLSSKKRKKIVRDLDGNAQKLLDNGNYIEALEIYKTILSCKDLLKKQKSKYYCKIGNIYNLQNLYDLSIINYKEAQYLYPKNLEIKISMAQIHLNNSLYSLAEKLFKEVLESDSKSEVAQIGLGNIYFYQKNYQKAAFYYEQVLSNDDKYSVLKLAFCYRQLKKPSKALEILNCFTKNKKATEEIIFLVAILLMDQGDFAKAKEKFIKYLEHGGSHIFQVYLHLANIYEAENNLSKTKEFLEMANYINPNYAITNLMLARVFYKLKDINSSKKHARLAEQKSESSFVKEQSQKLVYFLDRNKFK